MPENMQLTVFDVVLSQLADTTGYEVTLSAVDVYSTLSSCWVEEGRARDG